MLLAAGLLAPPVAKAGCSHLVTSKYDPRAPLLLLESLMADPAGRRDPLPVPPAPRPCSGAWCSGQPAVPAVPPSTVAGRLGTWAWFVPVPREASGDFSILTAENSPLRPLRRGNDVFHPPRLLLPV
jgi:hypothetical protein